MNLNRYSISGTSRAESGSIEMGVSVSDAESVINIESLAASKEIVSALVGVMDIGCVSAIISQVGSTSALVDIMISGYVSDIVSRAVTNEPVSTLVGTIDAGYVPGNERLAGEGIVCHRSRTSRIVSGVNNPGVRNSIRYCAKF